MNYINKIKYFFVEKLSNDRHLIYHILFVLFAFLFIGVSINFHFLTHYISGMDTFQWLNFDGFMKKSLFVWNPDSSGSIEPMAFTPFIYNLILKAIKTLTNHLILSINIYWMLFIYFLQISFFYFYRIFFSGKKALLATLFTFLNIKIITSLYAPLVFVNIALIAFPLMFFLLHSYIFKKRFIYAFLYIVFQIVLFRVLNVLIMANILVPALIFFLFKNQIVDKMDFFKKVVVIWVLSFLVCSMSIINLGVSFQDVSNNTNVQVYNKTSTLPFYTDRDSLLNLFRLTNHFSLADDKSEFPGLVYFKFSKLYMESWFFITISFLFFGLLLVNFIKNIKDKKIIVIMTCLVFFIFLAKTLNPPGEFINQWLYSSSFYVMFFRSGSKYFMYMIMPLAILAIFLGKVKFRLFYPLILLYIFSHAFLIFFYASPMEKYWNTTLPSEYLATAAKLDSLQDGNKILILPISPRPGGEQFYDDGYAGTTRLSLLSSKNFVSKGDAVYRGSDKYNKIFNSLIDGVYRINSSMIDYNASPLNYRYILIEKDAVYYPKSDFSSTIKTASEIEKKLDKGVWDKIFENNNDSLYKIKDGIFEGKINVSDSNLSFSNINPVKYKLHITDLKKAEDLSFIEAFHSGWKIYLELNPENEWCQSAEYFVKSNVTECENNQKLFEGKDLSYLWRKPIFDNTHRIVNQYANSWTIDPEYIKQNFPKEYYKENPDGSIDVEMTLYFKTQGYFYLGLFVSGITIIGCMIYLLYDRRNKKDA